MIKLQKVCNDMKNGSGPGPPRLFIWQQYLKEQVKIY